MTHMPDEHDPGLIFTDLRVRARTRLAWCIALFALLALVAFHALADGQHAAGPPPHADRAHAHLRLQRGGQEMNRLNLKRKSTRAAAPQRACPNHPERPARARGLCTLCYQRWINGPTYREPSVEVQAGALDRLHGAMLGWPATPHPWA